MGPGVENARRKAGPTAPGSVMCSAGMPSDLASAGEVDLGIGEVHADEVVVAVEGLEALLDDAIAAVVGDHVGDRQLEVRRRPQRLDGVHGAAVARVAAHLTRRLRERDADRGRHAPADAAGRQRVEAVAVAIGDEIGQVARRR